MFHVTLVHSEHISKLPTTGKFDNWIQFAARKIILYQRLLKFPFLKLTSFRTLFTFRYTKNTFKFDFHSQKMCIEENPVCNDGKGSAMHLLFKWLRILKSCVSEPIFAANYLSRLDILFEWPTSVYGYTNLNPRHELHSEGDTKSGPSQIHFVHERFLIETRTFSFFAVSIFVCQNCTHALASFHPGSYPR